MISCALWKTIPFSVSKRCCWVRLLTVDPTDSSPEQRSPKLILLRVERDLWLEIRLHNEEAAAQLEAIAEQVKQQRDAFRRGLRRRKRKLKPAMTWLQAC